MDLVSFLEQALRRAVSHFLVSMLSFLPFSTAKKIIIITAVQWRTYLYMQKSQNRGEEIGVSEISPANYYSRVHARMQCKYVYVCEN